MKYTKQRNKQNKNIPLDSYNGIEMENYDEIVDLLTMVEKIEYLLLVWRDNIVREKKFYVPKFCAVL